MKRNEFFIGDTIESIYHNITTNIVYRDKGFCGHAKKTDKFMYLIGIGKTGNVYLNVTHNDIETCRLVLTEKINTTL